MMTHFRIPPRPPMVERTRPMTMGDLQHFCLRWNNYQNSITTAFENLRDDEDFIDVTLACDGKTLKAHRVVLSACSPYFKELLKSTPCTHPVIVLQDVVFDDLHALVEFIYHGEVNVHQRNLTSFLKTAEVLKVSGLTQQNAAAPSTPAPSASPNSDLYNENLPSTRFLTRSPNTPPDKTSHFQPPTYNNTQGLSNSNATDDQSSPKAIQQSNRHRRHIRSPTPIRSSYSRDDSPIPLKRAKSAENAPSPNTCSSVNSPTTVLIDDAIKPIRQRKNSYDESVMGSRQNSPSRSDRVNSNYDENHNDEPTMAAMAVNRGSDDDDDNDDDDDDDESSSVAVDFSTNSVKKYAQHHLHESSHHYSPPKNLSLKCEPMDLVSTNVAISAAASGTVTGSKEADQDNNNQFDDNSSNWEDRLSDQSPPSANPYPPALLDHDDTFPGHRNYIDSKLFAAGASFSFNMAAALAADSLAGFNHHPNHANLTANAVIDGLSNSNPGRSFNGSMVCADWTELERRGGNQGQGGGGGSGGLQQHGCFICGKMLSTRLTLKRHIEQQHHQPLHSAVCTICHKVFRTLNSLNNHKSIYHRKPKWNTSSSTINS